METDIRDFYKSNLDFLSQFNENTFFTLKEFLIGETDIKKASDLLFQLGHENEIHNNILDVEFTPNKGDCLSVLGLARDLNAVHETNLI